MSEVLKNIADANAAGTPIFVSAAEGMDLVKAGYITVDQGVTDPNDATRIKATITEAGAKYLSG